MTITKRIYERLPIGARAAADRARFALGVIPRVEAPAVDAPPAFPEPHRWAFVVSADLELAWAWRYANGFPDPLGAALELADRSRKNMPGLLELFRANDTPVTWATVGHLFLDSCARDGDPPHGNAGRIPYFSNELWTYDRGDWYDADPCSDLWRDPQWYAPDLVDAIVTADARHEIGCHTFSHVDFSDGTCPPDVAEREIELTVAAAEEKGIRVDTMVFPGNRAGNLAALRSKGFRAYRLHSRNHLGVPHRDDLGMWRIPGGLCWERPPGWSVRPWIAALCRAVDAAVSSGTLLHLWFHPSCDSSDVDTVFPAVLAHIESKPPPWRATMRKVAEWCETGGDSEVSRALG